MTGIEKLREWAKELREAARAHHDGEIGYVPIDVEACQRKNAARLDAIADQIEREIDEAVADEVADTLSAYEMNTNARWYSAVEDGPENDCRDEYELISRYWLPRPRFEDGEPVQVGDKYVDKYGNVATSDTVVVSNHGFTLYDRGSATHFKLTESVKRPEPPDSWERIEADSNKRVCEYFGRKALLDCAGCSLDGIEYECELVMVRDLVRRAKKLAGVE